MNPLKSPTGAPSISQLAAAWALAAEETLSERQRARRDAWLAADSRHADAYYAAMATLTELNRHAAHPDIMELRQAALAARPERGFVARRIAGWAACVVAIGLVGVLAWNVFKQSNIETAPVYVTAVGERSTVPLADGSVITLNTASAVEVAYEASERKVRLLNGQALFTVAHGQPAPFRVYAGGKVVTAVGTVFDLRVDDGRVMVSVLEGAVRVEPGSRDRADAASFSADAEMLVAGQALTSRPDGAVSVQQTDVERLASWRSGLLSFEDTPLAEAVAEINRYTHRPVTLADPRLGEYRVSGTFRVGEPERFAQFMTELFPLAVESSASGTVIKAP
ncbi:MAG TPA: FecR domain-containing protein [Steroidobacter sp.]|uniref:FecR family protein n=1 Tax=Steroidobacter sp. TaxID=1978227 RepID=UPI002ED80415